MIHGSMTPKQIEWDLPISLGCQLQTDWWQSAYDPKSELGVPCKRVINRQPKEDILG